MLLEQTFVVLDKQTHDLKSFDCGKVQMNEFLKKHASKHAQLGISRTYVLPEANGTAEKKKVAAYFTLSSATVKRSEIPVTGGLPSYPVPVVLLARLAISKDFQGKGLGSKSLVYALRQARALTAGGLPAFRLILDILDEDAMGFYRQFGFFTSLTDNPRRLFVAMKTLADI